MQNQYYRDPQQISSSNGYIPHPAAQFPPSPMGWQNYSGPQQEESITHPLPTPRPRGSTGVSRRLLILVSAGVLLALLGAVLFVTLFALKSSPSVTLYQVGVQNVTQDVGGGGIVFPYQQIVMSYPEVEQAVKVLVQAGDTVAVNQPLIQLDTSQLDTQIQQASDEVSAAQAYLDSVSSSGSAVAIAQAQQQYTLAKSKYNALVAQASSLTLNHGNLVAPLAGVVTEVDIDSGEVFAANAPLLTIMDESTVIVHVKVPLADLGQVHVGEPAEVTPSSLPNVDMTGQVASIIPQADPQTDTFEVWVTVSNPDGKLLPGMSAFVRIHSTGQAFVVPRLAVLNPDRDSAVFVVRNQRAYLQHVHVVGRTTNALYIDAGLSEHDDVVLIGQDRLQDNEPIHVARVENV
jgi:RND family efflux transporter MFP subunit